MTGLQCVVLVFLNRGETISLTSITYLGSEEVYNTFLMISGIHNPYSLIRNSYKYK